MKRSRLYDIWNLMKQRCTNSNRNDFSRYGGKGIKVCDEWKKRFEAFRDWALSHGYQDDLTLDRIDSSGNYEPDNCRWVDYKTQNNNSSHNKYVTYKGKTQTLAEWAEELGMNYFTLQSRITKRHWDIERALTTPIKER